MNILVGVCKLILLYYIYRERREQEVRELEKQQKEREVAAAREKAALEREKLLERERQERFERDRIEKQKQAAEQAVHRHFEESLRRASQKVCFI